MKIYKAKNKNGFRVKLEETESASIIPDSGATIETEGKRGGYTVSGCFAAMSLKITPPKGGNYTDCTVDIFCRNKNPWGDKFTFDNEYRVHFNICSLDLSYDLHAQKMFQFYIETMTYKRALEICKAISAGNLDDFKNLVTEDFRLLDYLGIKLYKQVLEV